MNLVIDYGNSSAKVGIFDGPNLRERHVFPKANALQDFLQRSMAENFIISSVNIDPKEVSSWAIHAKKKFVLHHTLPLPIKNLYATPETLGVDRIAGACGAHHQFPQQNCLVIDAGTCVTYDFIDIHGNYHGGGISPGLAMRFQAVHTFTAKLPLVKAEENVPLIGNTTERCIQSGIIHGMVEEIDGIIRKYQEKFPGLKVISCGGDALFFENKLKASIFAVPELVLSGLNSILIHNVNL